VQVQALRSQADENGAFLASVIRMRLPNLSLFRGIALAFGALACTPWAVADDTGTRFDRVAWQQDYAQLKQALEQGYANLAWFGSLQGGADLPALDRQTQRALDGAENDSQAAQALRDFVAGFHDGHFSFLSTLAPTPTTSLPAPALREDLAGLEADAACAVLTSANGRIEFSLPIETIPGFHLTRDGLAQPFRSGTWTSAGGVRTGVVRIHSFDAGDYPALCKQEWVRLRGLPSQDEMKAELEDAWYAALAGVLREFAHDGVDTLLVDIGSNPGGDDSGDIATRLFSARPLQAAPLLVSQADTGAAYLDEQIERLSGAVDRRQPDRRERALLREASTAFATSRHALTGPACDLSWVWHERRDWAAGHCRRLVPAGTSGGPLGHLPADAIADLRLAHRLDWTQDTRAYWGSWTGPVYLLTDGKTYSSAEMFAARLHDNGVARTVGERSGGDGCGFMVAAEPVRLSHSGLRLRMPNCVRLRGDGSDEVAGVAADLPVVPSVGEDARVRALRVLDTVATDWRAHPGR